MNRHFILKNYSWLGFLLGGLSVSTAYALGGDDRIGLVGAAIAGTLGFYYFAQQQKLSETELFHKLFTDFNARYGKLHGVLAEIATRNSPPTAAEYNTVVDYFNLCAEEYLFYQEGYVRREAWRSWCRGMLWYLRRHPFKGIWHEQIAKESFYGLSLSVIEEGAGLKTLRGVPTIASQQI